ncbi:MAG: response regulator [Chitinophagaceae bacterium]|nr:MAG: response regulator [Chitinophagaceae bacterium]
MAENAILIVDDDQDDLDLIADVFRHLKIERPVHYFTSGKALEDYLLLESASPFLIICDVNLPDGDGFAIKKRIADNPQLKYKSVPFIYWSTTASEKQIKYAYDLPAQGFFFKPNNFDDLCDTVTVILGYWQKSQHPKKVS